MMAKDHFGGVRVHEKDTLRHLHTVSFGVRILEELGRSKPPCGHTTRLISLSYFTLPQKRWVRVWGLNRSSIGICEVVGIGSHEVLLVVRPLATWVSHGTGIAESAGEWQAALPS